MPVEYLTPGVYVEEVESGLKPIAGVGTNTAAIIGEVGDVVMPPQPGKREMVEVTVPDPNDPKKTVVKTELDPDDPAKIKTRPVRVLKPVLYPLAPVAEPKLITSWEQFKTNFGDFQEPNKRLAHA